MRPSVRAMQRNVLHLILALGLLGFGWSVGHAQNTDGPDFAFVVKAPAGETMVECVKGCNLLLSIFTPSRSAAGKSFKYTCKATDGDGKPSPLCGAREFNGYLVKSN